jgi:hypothetical protein
LSTQYKIRLTGRNESIEYRDELVTCRFGLGKIRREWILELPGIWDDGVHAGELSISDAERVLPRLVDFLSKIYWFGFIPMRYSVRVVRRDGVWQDLTKAQGR